MSSSSTAPREPAPMAPISRENRPSIVGPESVEAPYPLRLGPSAVITGFGRGSRELGIPTANLPDEAVKPLSTLGMTGIYYGFARIHPPSSSSSNPSTSQPIPIVPVSAYASLPDHTAPYPENDLGSNDNDKSKSNAKEESESGPQLDGEDFAVWPMVMSCGHNPFYKNEHLTAEVHILHTFPKNFYGSQMSVLVLGYVRPELDYISKEALIADINTDVAVSLKSLARPAYQEYAKDSFFFS